jgi:hypothetical protein
MRPDRACCQSNRKASFSVWSWWRTQLAVGVIVVLLDHVSTSLAATRPNPPGEIVSPGCDNAIAPGLGLPPRAARWARAGRACGGLGGVVHGRSRPRRMPFRTPVDKRSARPAPVALHTRARRRTTDAISSVRVTSALWPWRPPPTTSRPPPRAPVAPARRPRPWSVDDGDWPERAARSPRVPGGPASFDHGDRAARDKPLPPLTGPRVGWLAGKRVEIREGHAVGRSRVTGPLVPSQRRNKGSGCLLGLA